MTNASPNPFQPPSSSQPAPFSSLPTPNSPPIPDDSSSTTSTSAIGCGGVLLASSVCGALAFLAMPFQVERNALELNTLLAALTAIALVYGGALFAFGMALRRRIISVWSRWPAPWIFVLLFVGVIGAGQLFLRANIAEAYLFPPWHVLASLMIPLATMAYVARRLPLASGRSLLAQFVWGGLIGLLIIFFIEILVVIILLILAIIVLIAWTGTENASQLMALLSNADNLTDLIREISQEPSLLVIGGCLALLMFVVLVPFLEEAIKVLGSVWLMRRRKPSYSTTLLWGFAAGAGFAFTENLLNGAGGVTSQSGATVLWALAMLMRAGTSLMHMAATATLSVGCAAILLHQARGRFVRFLLTTLGVHGLWNLLVVGMAASASGTSGTFVIGRLLACMALVILLGLIAAMIGWVRWLIAWAIQEDENLKPSPPPPLVLPKLYD